MMLQDRARWTGVLCRGCREFIRMVAAGTDGAEPTFDLRGRSRTICPRCGHEDLYSSSQIVIRPADHDEGRSERAPILRLEYSDRAHWHRREPRVAEPNGLSPEAGDADT
jgi:hypothetical protein